MKPGSKDPEQIVTDRDCLLESYEKEPFVKVNSQNISNQKNMSDEEMLSGEMSRRDSTIKPSMQEMAYLNK
jgi:hypothetical protein